MPSQGHGAVGRRRWHLPPAHDRAGGRSACIITVRAGIDEVARFSRSRSVPAHFGMTLRATNQASWTVGGVFPSAETLVSDGRWSKQLASSCARGPKACR